MHHEPYEIHQVAAVPPTGVLVLSAIHPSLKDRADRVEEAFDPLARRSINHFAALTVSDNRIYDTERCGERRPKVQQAVGLILQ